MTEADEILPDDLQAAADFYDQLWAAPPGLRGKAGMIIDQNLPQIAEGSTPSVPTTSTPSVQVNQKCHRL